MVGAFFYRGTYFLVSQIGSYILAVLMIMIGGLLFSKMSSHELLEHLQHAGEKVQQWLEGSPEKQAAREERKAQKLLKSSEKKQSVLLFWLRSKEKNQVRPFTEEERAAQSEPDLSEIEPEQLSFVPIDHFQELPKNTASCIILSGFGTGEKKESVEEMEDDGEVLEFEISEEAENRDYELPSAELLDSIPATDQSSEYKKSNKTLVF